MYTYCQRQSLRRHLRREKGHSRVRGPATSSLQRRGWQGWGKEIRGPGHLSVQGLGQIIHSILTGALRGRGPYEPILQMEKLSLRAVTYPIRGPADKPPLGASQAPFSFDFRLSGPPVQDKEAGGRSLRSDGISENMRVPSHGDRLVYWTR